MIYESVLGYFIIRYLLTNPNKSLFEIINDIFSYLSVNFILEESVISKKHKKEALVVGRMDGLYKIKLDACGKSFVEEVFFDNIRRLRPVKKRDIIRFVDIVTKVSPKGRVFKYDMFDFDRSIFKEAWSRKNCVSNMIASCNQSLEHYSGDRKLLFPKELRICKNFSLHAILPYISCPEVENKFSSSMSLVLDVVCFLKTFRKHLNVDFSVEEFMLSISSRKYNSEFVFRVHKELLQAIKVEVKKMPANEVKGFFDNAIEVSGYKTDRRPGSEKYFECLNQWIKRYITRKNWKSVVEQLFSCVFSGKKTHLSEIFSGSLAKSDAFVDRRLEALKLLITCISSVKKFSKPPHRVSLKSGVGNSSTQESFLRWMELHIQKGRRYVIRMTQACELGIFDGLRFVFLEDNIFFLVRNTLFKMHRCHIKCFLQFIESRKKEYSGLVKFMRAYVGTFGLKLHGVMKEPADI